MSITVGSIFCYPLKSARGISLQSAEIGRTGILYDRQWMVVEEASRMFVAQRGDRGLGVAVRSMCLVETCIDSQNLTLAAPDMPHLQIPLSGIDGGKMWVQVWESRNQAVDQGDEAARWFTKFLSKERPAKYRLVRMPSNEIRKTKLGQGQLAFADGYPFLIVSQASLDDLNSRMEEPLPVDRFRPNIVLDSCEPYEEDNMGVIRIGKIGSDNVIFEGMKLCVRCPITTFNQLTAERGKEPLKTLAKYRKTEKGVVFAKNFNNIGNGRIAVGDAVTVLSHDLVVPQFTKGV